MAVQDKETLKRYFKNGKKPNENQFADLIDSIVSKDETVSMEKIDGLIDELERETSERVASDTAINADLKNYATKEYVDGKIPSGIVTIEDAQSITGAKTFSEAKASEVGTLSDKTSTKLATEGACINYVSSHSSAFSYGAVLVTVTDEYITLNQNSLNKVNLCHGFIDSGRVNLKMDDTPSAGDRILIDYLIGTSYDGICSVYMNDVFVEYMSSSRDHYSNTELAYKTIMLCYTGSVWDIIERVPVPETHSSLALNVYSSSMETYVRAKTSVVTLTVDMASSTGNVIKIAPSKMACNGDRLIVTFKNLSASSSTSVYCSLSIYKTPDASTANVSNVYIAPGNVAPITISSLNYAIGTTAEFLFYGDTWKLVNCTKVRVS